MRRGTIAVLLLATPLLVATALLAGTVVRDRIGDASGVRNSAEAAGAGNAAAMLQFLRRGEQPGQVQPLRPEIISSTVQFATTWEAAMWARRIELFRLLDRERLLTTDPEERRSLACLASDLGLPEIADFLVPTGRTCVAGEAQARVMARTPRSQ